ncbi:septum formation family protein [Arthrobacter sp. I2-34]|uniref:Septum formation family protein n=1 Tax=Arthrobacter hankyongi TaxID=2904801 RepID=A0ABS9LA54_9MICC|nr:septum formation family protein [Arthrobacter hankyongi]MCG2623562.1 septum formation family protein [Arthrobacter hankyongi]
MSEQSRPAGGGSAPGGGSGAGHGPEAPDQDAAPGTDRLPAAAPGGPTPPSQWTPPPPPADGGPAEPDWYTRPAPATSKLAAQRARPAGPAGWKRWLAIGIPVLAALAVTAGIFLSLRQDPSAARSADASASESAGTGPGGVIAKDVSPLDFKAGDCFTDFQAVTLNATVVTCSTPHAAQNIGTFSYQPSDPFPGKDALNAKAEQVCTAIKLNKQAGKYPSLRTSYGMPSEGTWQEGDRRIDCFVIVDGGNKLKESLIGG